MELTREKILNSFSVYKGKIFLALKFIIAAGLLSYIISSIELPEIIKALQDADYLLIFSAFILVVPNIYLQYFKWKLTCKSILNVDDKEKIFFSLFQGFAAGAFTPFRVGEYFGRAFLFKDKTLVQITIATLVDKIFPLIILAFAGSISGLAFIYYFYDVSFYIAVSLLVVISILFYLVIHLLIDPDFWNNFLFNKIRNSQRLYKYLGRLRFLKHLEKNYSAKMFFISFLFYSCFLFQFIILVAAFSNEINFSDYLWGAVLVMFAKTFFPAISFGELGVREGVSVFFLGQFGVAAAAAFNASFFLFFINILVPSLFGLIFLFKKNNA